MAAEGKNSCYEGEYVHSFGFYLEHSGEHRAVLECVSSLLPERFRRMGEGKSSFDVLGVGSGGGEVDIQMLTLLQSVLPDVPITTDIVEGSSKLVSNFKVDKGHALTYNRQTLLDTPRQAIRNLLASYHLNCNALADHAVINAISRTALKHQAPVSMLDPKRACQKRRRK
ncbi:histamine N-methyltransferase A-like [Pholidichthys leucotaenia]